MACEKLDGMPWGDPADPWVLPDPFNMGFNPARGPCSGRGVCLNETSTCVCDDPDRYSGRVDFFDLTTEDGAQLSCHNDFVLERALWCITFVVCVVYTIISVPRIRLRWTSFLKVKQSKNTNGQTYSVTDNRGLMAILFAFGLCLPAVALMAMVRISLPRLKVGLDLVPTLLFGLAKTGFYLAVYWFQPALIASVLRGNRATRKIVSINYRINGAVSFLGVLGGWLPLILYIHTAASGAYNGDIAVIVYYLHISFTLLQVTCLGVQAAWVKAKVTEALNLSLSVTKSAKTEAIKTALVKVQNENIVQTSVQGVLFLSLMLIPTLMLSHSYFLAVSWCAYAILSKKIAFTAVSDSKYGTRSTTTGADGSFGSSSRGKDDPSSFNGNSSSMVASTAVSFAQPSSGNGRRTQGPNLDAPAASTLTRQFQENVVSFHEAPLPGDRDSSDGGASVQPEEDDYV